MREKLQECLAEEEVYGVREKLQECLAEEEGYGVRQKRTSVYLSTLHEMPADGIRVPDSLNWQKGCTYPGTTPPHAARPGLRLGVHTHTRHLCLTSALRHTLLVQACGLACTHIHGTYA